MKHIKFAAKCLAPNFTSVEVTILQQTHRYQEFGERGDSFTHNGFTISSCDCPEAPAWAASTVFMQGRKRHLDNTPIILTTAKYQKFKAAVEAYNARFAAAPAPAPASKCSFIVG